MRGDRNESTKAGTVWNCSHGGGTAHTARKQGNAAMNAYSAECREITEIKKKLSHLKTLSCCGPVHEQYHYQGDLSVRTF